MRTLILGALLAAPLSAQTFGSISAGGAQFDLSGTGTAFVADARVVHFINRNVAVEGGLALSPVSEQFREVTYLLPSAELQVGTTIRDAIRPYLGAGLGAFFPISDDGTPTRGFVNFDPTAEAALTLSAGVDAGVTDSVILRVTGRLRGTLGEGPDVFVGTFAELTGGLGVRIN
ncbi:MAG: hypothetical protein AAGK21_04605 [Bacteroidota bacterium]